MWMCHFGLRDRPESEKPAYFAGFFGFFFADGDFLCGSGGMASIRRRTSSIAGGSRLGFSSFMAGV